MQYAVDIESARIELLGSCAGLLMISLNDCNSSCLCWLPISTLGYQFLPKKEHVLRKLPSFPNTLGRHWQDSLVKDVSHPLFHFLKVSRTDK